MTAVSVIFLYFPKAAEWKMESVVKKNKLPLVESRSRGSKSFDISGAVNNVESLRECAGSG